MADYCTIAEALSLLGAVTLTATSDPTSTQGATMLAQVTNEIDMHLRAQDYTLPVSDTEALASLKAIAMSGAAAKIAKAKWPADRGPGGDEGVYVPLREDYKEGLAFIDAGGLSHDSTPEEASVSHGFSTWTHPLADEPTSCSGWSE